MANVTNTTIPRMTKGAVKQYLSTCTYEEILELLFSYFEQNNIGGSNKMKASSMVALQEKMLEKKILTSCPHCGSVHYVKNGTQKSTGLTCFKCKDCGKKFNIFTDTILENTRWSWELWVKVLEMTINNMSIDDMLNVLKKDYGCDGLCYKTVWQWRMKLIHALAMMPQPTLTCVIQIDQTYIREFQKGSRTLVNYLPYKYSVRLPRYGYKPSVFGIMGPEFCTVVTAIDERGYCVCKVSAMGKLTDDVFYDTFDRHIENPTYICTDAYPVYSHYCTVKDYSHYIKPSNYDEILYNNGYIRATPLAGAITEIEAKQNHSIKKALYKQGEIDKIGNNHYPYKEFNAIKKGFRLSLGRVNELHADIKHFIYSNKANVSSKYLQDYLGFFTCIRNWTVEHGNYPSSRTDAMEIFFKILAQHGKYTKKRHKKGALVLPKSTNKFLSLLKVHTDKVRKETSNQYFKFNTDDGIYTFDRRAFLTSQPRNKLHEICRIHNIRRYSKWPVRSLVVTIMKLPDIDSIIASLIAGKRDSLVDDEDKKAIAASRYKH